MRRSAKPRPAAVDVEKSLCHRAARPIDDQRGVVPGQAAQQRGVVEVAEAEHDLGVGLEGAEAVREPRRHDQLIPLAGGQLNRHVMAEGRRGAPDVHHHVVDSAPRHADDLGLGVRRRLKVQAAHGVAQRIARRVLLHHPRQAQGLEIALVVEIGETCVWLLADRRAQQAQPVDRQGVRLDGRAC